MKIAICISGNKGRFSEVKDNIKEMLLYSENIVFTVLDEYIDIETNRNLYINEQSFYIDNLKSFNNHKREETIVNNTLQMYYKIYKCSQLKQEYEKEKNIKFDICVRTRPDLLFFNKIDFNYISDNKIVIPEDYNYLDGFCDQFWYSDSYTYDKIAELYLKIPEYINDGCLFHPETLLSYHCNHNNIECIVQNDLKFKIYR